MTLSLSRTLTLTFFVASLIGFSACKSDGVQASSGGSAAEISGPPTFNEAYQSRNPRICAQVTSPPNAAQAAALVQCSTESDTTGSSTPLITLVTDLQVEIGSPRDYMAGVDRWSDTDVRAKVYPIRGQGTMWQCSPVATYGVGQNCANYPAAAGGQGSCYKTTFGDWKCHMSTGGPRQVTKLKGPTTY
jgi:hypothetical protein